jgi:hypothetical protein
MFGRKDARGEMLPDITCSDETDFHDLAPCSFFDDGVDEFYRR